MRKIFTCLSLLALFALSVAAQGQTTINLNEGDKTLQSGIYIISNYTGSNRIIIAQGAEVTITLENVQITTTTSQGDVSPFDASGAKSVTLLLKGENTLTAVQEAPGLYAPQGFDYGRSITIKDAEDDNTVGSLSATGAEYWPGIGIEDFYSTNITIESGKITATGGRGAAGIGADGSYDGTITISGGTVTAIGGRSGDGIGAGANGSEYSMGTFSTGENGSAVIFASSITDNDDKSNWSGVIFEGNIGKVYGTPFSLTSDFTIPSGYILPIPEGTTLIIPNNITVTNNGTIINYGTVTNNGTINGSGIIYSTSDIANAATTKQESTSYIDCNGTQQVAPTFPMIANMHEWIDGWYVVTGDMTFNERITIPGDVTLILADGCNLNATQGINVGEGQSLTIYAQSTEKDMGALIATGGENNAGIGGDDGSGGTIIISGGTVTATGGVRGAGIGGGNNGEGGTIIISGGTVTATGGSNGAGIGGSQRGSGGTITISGGTVTATGNSYGAGIGGGNGGNGGTVTITGGTVTATGGSGWYGSGVGIGTGGSATEGTFSTGENGNAVIFANSITDNDDTNGWSGVIFVKNDQSGYDGKVYGSPAIESFTMESNHTLEVPAGTTLTIPEGVTLYNNGTITNSSTISGSGRIVGNKPTGEGANSVTQYYYVTRHLNYEEATDPENPIEVKENETIPSEGLTPPSYYTFEGWYDAETEGNKVESATTNNLEVYARWTPNSFTTKEGGITFDNLIYGTAFEHPFTAEELSDNITEKSGGLASIAVKEPEGEEGTTNALPTGLTLEGLTLSGTTEAATPSDVTTILTLTANNGATADITLTFTIAKAEATVADWTTESPYIYTGKAITITAPKVTGINDEDVTYTDVTVAYKQGETDVEAAIEPGEYTATATYTGNSNYADTSKEVTFVIQSPDDITASASEGVLQAGDNGWMRLANGQSYPVTLTAPTNYTFTEEAMATISGDGEHTYTLKRSESSQTATVSHMLYLDATAPTATLGTPSSTTVVLTLADATSGIATCTVKEGETELYTYPESTAETRSGETKAGAITGEHSLSYTYTGQAGTSHTLTVTLTDMAGNTAEQTLTVTFTKYTITLQQPENGSISADKTEAAEGETVTLSYREDSNYDFADWSVTTDDGTAVSVSGNTFTMPAADVTVTASFHYDPPYIPSYYDIYFDDNENDSVRYDCSNTSIREGGTFAFYAEPTTGYDPETLIVEYKRGRAGSWKTVEPNSRGQYRITNVHADIYVRSRVEPIEDPTALDKVGDGKSSIRCDGRRIRISTTEPQTMHIINVGGRLIRTAQLPAGDTEVNDLPQGFYIVLLSDGTRAKTLIN